MLLKNKGTFFLPKDQQRARPSRTTDYEGLAYFGEYPLAWAACCNNESAYNLLIDRGADPNAQDSFGNMVLHMVVVCDKLVGSFDCVTCHTHHRHDVDRFTGNVRIRSEASQTAGQNGHCQQSWPHTPDLIVPSRSGHHLP